MSSHVRMVGALCAVLVLGSAAGAGTITSFVNDRPGWEAAVNHVFVEEQFDDATLEPGVTINAPGGVIQNGRLEDNVDASDVALILFDPDVTAAGIWLDLDPATAGTGIDFYVVFPDSSSEVILIRSISNHNGFTGFVGVTADMPIDFIRMTEGNQTSIGSAEFYHADDLVFAQNPAIPAPSALGLAGVAGLVMVRRRRR